MKAPELLSRDVLHAFSVDLLPDGVKATHVHFSTAPWRLPLQ